MIEMKVTSEPCKKGFEVTCNGRITGNYEQVLNEVSSMFEKVLEYLPKPIKLLIISDLLESVID